MSNEQTKTNAAQQFHVRTYRPSDQGAVEKLYADGLFTGQIATNDTGADIDNINDAYFSSASDHFWVVEHQGQVLGMIGVVRDGRTAEIRRLRVAKDWQHTPIGDRLVETALAHCRENGELKVVLDTRFERDHAVELFTRFGFQHARTKTIHGKETLEFYVDLYRSNKHEDSKDPGSHSKGPSSHKSDSGHG